MSETKDAAQPGKMSHRPVKMSRRPAEGKGEPRSFEVVTGGVDEKGNIIVDDLVGELDSEGHIIATDETTVIETTGGDFVVDETFSVAGEDGTLHAISEDVTVLEAERADPPLPTPSSRWKSTFPPEADSYLWTARRRARVGRWRPPKAGGQRGQSRRDLSHISFFPSPFAPCSTVPHAEPLDQNQRVGRVGGGERHSPVRPS